MKRLIVCCDGTWQSSDGGEPYVPTNVTRIARALKSVTDDGVNQIVYYQSGVGTGGTVDKIIGGTTGLGLSEHVREAYGFLAHNYHPGDTIHMFGFSRGAYTARSVCGLISRIGLLTKKGMDGFYQIYQDYTENKLRDPEYISTLQEREDGTLVTKDVRVQTIGCWDTVGSLGIPNVGLPFIRNIISGAAKKKYGFHDTDISDIIDHAFHALALDERRTPFTPTLWNLPETNKKTTLKQVWFPGVHSNVGGGYADQELADITLAWMVSQTRAFLAFDKGYLEGLIHGNNMANNDININTNTNHITNKALSIAGNTLNISSKNSSSTAGFPITTTTTNVAQMTPAETWSTGKIYNSSSGVMRLIRSTARTPGEYGPGTYESIHQSVRVRMELVKGWESKALAGWKWVYASQAGGGGGKGGKGKGAATATETGGGVWVYEKNGKSLRLEEDELEDIEKVLAGEGVVVDLLGEEMPTSPAPGLLAVPGASTDAW